jgi:hypothetical protein
LTLERVVSGGAIRNLHTFCELSSANITQIRISLRAHPTSSACRDKSEDDMVAGFKPRHTFANFNNDSGAFVSTNDRHWGSCSRQITSHEVFIGMAHS